MMEINIIQYLFEASIGLLSFYLLYYVALRQETFFQFNRIYLLLMPLIAMAIPFFNISLQAKVSPAEVEILYPVVHQVKQLEEQVWGQIIASENTVISLQIGDVLYWIYWLGVGLMLMRLANGISQLMWRISCARSEEREGITYLQTEEQCPASSFFSYVFWNKDSKDEKYKLILEHELVHVRQWHSLDVLLMECWVILKWFNPIIYLYRKHLRLIHEFIADQYVVERKGERIAYAQLMVQAGTKKEKLTLTNNFNSLTKMRLVMLAKHQSNHWKRWKYLLVLPTIGGLMMLFSFNMAVELPGEVLEPLAKAETLLEKVVEQELFSWEKNATTFQLKWGDMVCGCKAEQFKNYYKCDNLTFSPGAYKALLRKAGPFELLADGKPLGIAELTIMGSRMVDMGGYQGQFDESGKIDKSSLLWKNPKMGDVYKFDFRGGETAWFTFEVVINNRKAELGHDYIVDLGDYAFSVDMTNMIGVRTFNFVDFQRAMQHPFYLKEANGETLGIAKVEFRNFGAQRVETMEEVGRNAISLDQLMSIREAMAGDNVNINLTTEKGEKIRIDLLLRENAASKEGSRKLALIWGDLKVDQLYFRSISLRAQDVKRLRKEPLYLSINDELFRIVSGNIPGSFTVQAGKMQEKKAREHISIEEILSSIDNGAIGRYFYFNAISEKGHKTDLGIHIEKEIIWTDFFGNTAQFSASSKDGPVIITSISEEGLNRLSSLKFDDWRLPCFTINSEDKSIMPLADLPQEVSLPQIGSIIMTNTKDKLIRPLIDLPQNVSLAQIATIKIYPPHSLNGEFGVMGYIGKVVVYLKDN
ncbi:MAG: M56 family metallopeptidase [Saprospiraceae bacterium]